MSSNPNTTLLAVNGTLMRGLALNPNLTSIGATFLCETATEASYRLWTINDVHPAMQRVQSGGVSIAVEVWDVPNNGIASILLKEPPGLCIGKVKLVDGLEVLGVVGEAILCETQGKEITNFGGWRSYMSSKGSA
ncbi:hypothetical protein M427DRAFT_150547 [Gonapodya prolifera JEL478]|uniref:Allophanate hydrolase C-terminal domain-containing protein n=1 Tax=Gonapodya prolifera (strain JEL478) TaxID=1344416 RepID=A0A139AZR1_GONPJ|nr:hypothetical protein M427DRAFT_150547 [Gonapodya prolifera JEL478]|eukprot:KXS22197.1 hypothetical protein M427DRAFT_150547 [Gonapodya prolifera JEL478]